MSEWGATASVEEMSAWLASRRRTVVLTHVKPDGDAVGSTLALVRALNTLRPGSSEAWYTGPQPAWLAQVARATPHRIVSEAPADGPAGLDGVVVADTGSWAQLDVLEGWVRSRVEMAAIIDHHLQGNPEMSPRRLVDTSAAAACQPVAALSCRLLGAASASRLPGEIAEALYLGLGTDTGWFRHSNVNASVMRLAGDLLEAGIEHPRLYQLVEQQDRPSRLHLMARALSTLELARGDTIALMTLTRDDFRQAGAAPGESAGFVEIPLLAASVRVSAFLTEGSDPKFPLMTKVSFRSKELPDAVDVNVVARTLGGGGHARAAGARMACGLSEARRRVLEALS